MGQRPRPLDVSGVYQADAEYLISQSDSRNRIVGTDLVLPDLEAARYKPEVRISYQPQPDPWNKAAATRRASQPALLSTADPAADKNSTRYTN